MGINGKPTLNLEDGKWEKGIASNIKDADTVDILRENGEVVTCRVAKIDAPESAKPWKNQPDQAFSPEATQMFTSLLGDMSVDVKMKDAPLDKKGEQGNYGRKLCLLAKDGKSLNLELVKQGAAWADHFQGGDAEFIEAEAIAHAKKLGLHVDPNALYPKKYRDMYPDPKKPH